MKVVKPMVVSFRYRPFLMLGEWRLCATGMVGFALTEGAPRLVVDPVMWNAIGESTEGVVDEGLPKPCGEVLVLGKCHAPAGRRVPTSQVRVHVASAEGGARHTVDKSLAVFGDRFWHGRSMTDPVPFLEMPLGWDRAFGGEEYPKNPYGRGISPGEATDEIPLPNVETPTSLVTARSQRVEPAGFGPLEMGWPQRQSKAGTYDARWLEEEFPGYARDTDTVFFCTAPPDQRIDGFFRGDEEYVVQNMHPSRPVMKGKLPGVAARILLRRKGSSDVEDVQLRLDTLVLLPEKEIGILVFRGTTVVLDDDAIEIEHALAACEDLAEPRSVKHYTAALDRRLDKNESPKLALFEDDLVPPFAAGTDLAALGVPKDVVGATTAERERVLAETRKQVARTGVAAPEVEKALADAATRPSAPEAKAAPQAEPEPKPTPGTRPPKVGQGPPKPEARQLEETLRVASIEADAVIDKKLRQLRRADALALQAYRENAHNRPPARQLDADERARSREVMRERRTRGESFAGLEWTRYDLSQYNLQGGDFRETLLEGADFTRTNVARADLSRAVLAHAILEGACFDGATLEEANLGATVMDGVSFAGANLRKAILSRAKLRSVSLRDADLTEVEWLDVEMGAVDFQGATTERFDLLAGHDLTRCRFPRTKLFKATFFEVKLDGVDFAGADLESAEFLRVSANGADFRKASMKKFCASLGSSFEGANFEGADLSDAVMRGANLRGANLEGARLERANLAGCDLTAARLSGAQAKELNLVRSDLTDATLHGANLMEAMLQKTTLHGADLSASNLFQANLSLARISTSTKVRGANLKRALMLPRARKTT